MTKHTLTISSIDLMPIATSPAPEPNSDLYIDGQLLVKRINALIKHSSELGSETTADKHAREMSILMKTIKEIFAHNKTLADAEMSDEQTYTPAEEDALAAELADLIVKAGSSF